MHVVSRKRERIPDSVTPFAKELIEECWAQEPEDRPSFKDICSLLKKKLIKLVPDPEFDRLVDFVNKIWSLSFDKWKSQKVYAGVNKSFTFLKAITVHRISSAIIDTEKMFHLTNENLFGLTHCE